MQALCDPQDPFQQQVKHSKTSLQNPAVQLPTPAIEHLALQQLEDINDQGKQTLSCKDVVDDAVHMKKTARPSMMQRKGEDVENSSIASQPMETTIVDDAADMEKLLDRR